MISFSDISYYFQHFQADKARRSEISRRLTKAHAAAVCGLLWPSIEHKNRRRNSGVRAAHCGPVIRCVTMRLLLSLNGFSNVVLIGSKI